MELDDWTWNRWPTGDEAFDAMLCSVDGHLANFGFQPFQRPLHALRLVSRQLKLYAGGDVLERIQSWYAINYGQRMKLRLHACCRAFYLRGTLWRMRMPVVHEMVAFTVDADLGKSFGEGQYNILRQIDQMTRSYALHLGRDDLDAIGWAYMNGFLAIRALNDLVGHAYFDHARLDYEQSIDALMSGFAWARARRETTQCAANALKGLLARSPAAATDTQGLSVIQLARLVTTHYDVKFNHTDLMAVDGDMRGAPSADMDISPVTAYDAHVALLRLLAALGDATPSVGASRQAITKPMLVVT